jgi:GNAT superfamily N-acetyltransferase
VTSADDHAADPPASSVGAGAQRRHRQLELPIRPGTTRPTSCPWGHELAVGGMRRSWSQDYAAPEYLCEACHALPDRGGRWAVIDPSISRQAPEDHVDDACLQLVVVPPLVPRGVGAILLRHGATVFGQVRLTLCELDRCAVLVGLAVELAHRRRGAGTVLVAAAKARGNGYRWSSTPIGTDPVAIAFWGRVGLLGEPRPAGCTHQIDVGAVTEQTC